MGHGSITPHQLQTKARFLYGNHWYERIARKLRIRPREIDAMLRGEKEIPDEIAVFLVEALHQRMTENQDHIADLVGDAA